NFFVPSTKLIAKQRAGSLIVKKYDLPKTPFQRVLDSPLISDGTKEELQKLFLTLSPFVLQQHIQTKINTILKQADPLPRYILRHAQLS
ncbi:MAG: integrase, partial [Bacteroidetes bacterium]|nr:integrase [Bacteroidota bacterium]